MRAVSVAVTLLVLGANSAVAQTDFPTRPITLVVTQAAGGGMDSMGRILGRKMSASLGQSVVVENKPGGNEAIGITSVVKSAPDGYTLVITGTGGLTINPVLYKSLAYAPTDLRPIGRIGAVPLVVAAAASEPYKNISELVAYAKANPTKLSYGSPGIGGPHHLGMELIKSATGAPIQHVPYRGAAPATNDLLAGVIPLVVSTLSPLEPHIEAGKVRALITINKTRLPQLAQVPTWTEVLPSLDADVWIAMFAPAGIPDAAGKKLTEALKLALDDAEVRSQLERLGFGVSWAPPADISAAIPKDLARWAEAIKEAGLKPE